MEIKGEIKDIIYQNELNSYTVAEFTTEEADTVIVGYLPFVMPGDTLKLTGKIVTHQDYGEQFKVETFEKIMPETLGALERYLSNGLIKGVGPATAKKIVDTFGEETIHILKFEPKKLTRIRGITNEKAIEIAETFVENWELWQIVGNLEKYGIGVQNAKNVYKELGANAIEQIEENPYILVDIANNVDFKKIDAMAVKMGIPYNNDKRIKSGIKYAMNCVALNGHCMALKENLIDFCINLLNVSEEEISENLSDLKVLGVIVEQEYEEKQWLYLENFYKAEQNVANRIKIINNSDNIKKIKDIKKEIKIQENNLDIELSNKQKEAIQAINENNVCIITGGPGTGKTTIIKTIIEIYKKHGRKTILCAPTGRAAKRMTETTGEEAKTLHRLLEIGKMQDEGKAQSVDYDVAPIDGDIIIVDEMSMVDLFLMNYLLKGIFQGTKLVLVGDVDQLPSVGPGSVLKDLIESKKITTIVLDKIFRQAARSKIVLNAHRVNRGERFIQKNEEIQKTEEIEDISKTKKVKEIEKSEQLKEDFFFIKESDQNKMLYQIITLCEGRLKKYGDYDFFKNIQVITPTKKGMLGTKELNKTLQEKLNPLTESVLEKKIGDTIYREQDRVMQVKNNYDILWERQEPKYEAGAGVFNGELGTIEKIDEREKIVQIRFDDDKVAWYSFQDLDQIEHSYAITIHKSQGSEFDVVIMAIPQTSPILLTRNLLYTGMTRAKKLLIIIGNPNVVDYMLQNADTKKRNTGLKFNF